MSRMVGAAVLLLLLGGGVALVWASRPQLPSKPDIHGLQQLATQSCRCARQTSDKAARSACWSDFERKAAHYRPRRYSTLCDPVSPSGYCFGDDPSTCVVKEYSSYREASLCSLDEARIAEAAFEDAIRRNREGDMSTHPDRAFLAAAKALARGEKLTASSRDGGCSG